MGAIKKINYRIINAEHAIDDEHTNEQHPNYDEHTNYTINNYTDKQMFTAFVAWWFLFRIPFNKMEQNEEQKYNAMIHKK